MKLNRRDALKLAAQAVAAATTTSLLRAEERRKIKIGACEWSLRKSDPSCFEVARQIGLDGVQVDLGNPQNGLHLRRPEVQQAYLEAAKAQNVEIASLATAVFNNIGLKCEPRAAIWLNDAIGVAGALNVRVILVAQFYNGDLRGDQLGVDRTVDLLKELAPRAEKSGIILGLENYLSARENLKIIERVGSPAVQVYYDVGNSTDMGYPIYDEIRSLKGQICELHAKDGPQMLGQGRIDFHKVRAALDAIDYRGWIQIEAAAPHNLIEDYKADFRLLRSVLG